MTTYRRRRKKKTIPRGYVYIAALVAVLFVAIFIAYYIKKYSPTKEHMSLDDYFAIERENEAAVVLNGDYKVPTEEENHSYAIVQDKNVYLELGFVKEYIDDGYVYDPSEITLRYATDSAVYTATVGSADYTIDKSNNSLEHSAVIAAEDTVYIATDYIGLLSDFQVNYFDNPDRVFIETVGASCDLATAKGKGQIRKLNGPKSPVLEDVTKGEQLYVIRDTGKWSFVISENGVMGYIRNNRFNIAEKTEVAANLPERKYNHILLGKDISLLWHQVTNQAANADIANVLLAATLRVPRPPRRRTRIGTGDSGSRGRRCRGKAVACHPRSLYPFPTTRIRGKVHH